MRIGRSGPRRVYCVGLPKCGTHSLAAMFAGACRAAHEPDAEPLLPLLAQARSGSLPVGELRSFFRSRDRRLALDLESNHLLASFVPHLLDAFPRARFVVLVRGCHDWIDSMISDQLNLRTWDGYQRWHVVYDEYMVRDGRLFPPQERILEDLDLYPLAHYIRYWCEEPQAIMRGLPPGSVLALRTEDLGAAVPRIASFVGVSAEAVATERSHSYRSPQKHSVLDSIDSEYLERLIEAHAGQATEWRDRLASSAG